MRLLQKKVDSCSEQIFVCGDGWLMGDAESRIIRSADLWDARTDSRFVEWGDGSKKER